MDVPHSTRYPYLLLPGEPLVAGSKRKARGRGTVGRAPWTQVDNEFVRDCRDDASCH